MYTPDSVPAQVEIEGHYFIIDLWGYPEKMAVLFYRMLIADQLYYRAYEEMAMPPIKPSAGRLAEAFIRANKEARFRRYGERLEETVVESYYYVIDEETITIEGRYEDETKLIFKDRLMQYIKAYDEDISNRHYDADISCSLFPHEKATSQLLPEALIENIKLCTSLLDDSSFAIEQRDYIVKIRNKFHLSLSDPYAPAGHK
jgi:hypothetical protein